MKPIILLLICLVLAAAPATAQGNTLSLSVADYALLSTANTLSLDSFAFESTVRAVVEGLDIFSINVDMAALGALDVGNQALNVRLDGELAAGNTRLLPINTELRLINDTLYLNPGDGWQSRREWSDAAAATLDELTGLTAAAADLQTWQVQALEGVAEVLAGLAAIDPNVFVRAERLADEQINDVQTAHFQIQIDLYELMQTPAFVEIVAALAAAQGTFLVALDPAELAAAVIANSTLFVDASLTLDQYISTDDNLIHRFVFDLNLPLDPTRTGYPDAPFSVRLGLDATLTDHNLPQTISVPEDAEAVFAFHFPPQPPPKAAAGETPHYLWFETVEAGSTYTQTFATQAGDTVTITALGIGLYFDSRLSLLAPGGDLLAEDDDHMTPAFGMADFDPQIAAFALPESGMYSVEVNEFEGRPGSFVLSVSVQG